jgi:hypothetical protein
MTNEVISYVNSFNSSIKKLICDLACRHPTDAIIARIKKRVILVIDLEPVYIITAVGPHLYEYRDKIYSGDDAFFIDNDYSEELSRSCDDQSSIVMHIIPLVKNAWISGDVNVRGAYTEVVQELLDDYVEYLACQVGLAD